MSLLKLVYIAHGWNLEMTSRPLIANRIEAWRYGPVIPEVYKTFRPQGISPTKADANFPAPTEAGATQFLEQIYNIYGQMSPFRLSELTHVAGGPWDTATNWGGQFAVIPDDLILAHYVQKRQQSKQIDA